MSCFPSLVWKIQSDSCQPRFLVYFFRHGGHDKPVRGAFFSKSKRLMLRNGAFIPFSLGSWRLWFAIQTKIMLKDTLMSQNLILNRNKQGQRQASVQKPDA